MFTGDTEMLQSCNGFIRK